MAVVTDRVAEAANRRLARTINLGIDLGSPLERGWTVEIEPSQLDACVDAGFSAIRLCICWLPTRAPTARTPASRPRSTACWQSSRPPRLVGWPLS